MAVSKSMTTNAFSLEGPPPVKPIAASAQYYLSKDHTTTLKKELKTQLFLMFVCLTGAFLYWIPASAYATRENESDLAWLYIFSTCFPALAVLYAATDFFFKLHFSASIPSDMEDELTSPQTRGQRIAENSGITFLSSLSSIPVSLVIFAFPPKDLPLGWLILLAVAFLADNTVLHFLPVKLVLSQPIYNIPFLFFKYLWSKYRDRNLSGKEKAQRAYDQQKAADWLKLRELMVKRISMAQQRMVQQAFTWNKLKLQYDIAIPANVSKLTGSDKPLDLVLSFMPTTDVGPYCRIPSKLNSTSFAAVRIFGAIWIWSCATGYYAVPFNQFAKWTGSYEAAAGITALPIYFLSVLLAFFGEKFLGDLYIYFTSWGENVTKISMEVKLFPKLFVLLMAVNAVMANYSYAAAVELVYTNITYEWAKPLVPYLVLSAKTGIAFIAFLATRDYFMLMFMKVATHLGSKKMKAITKANEKIEQYKNSILFMNGEKFEAELKAMTPKERKQLLGINNDEFKVIIDHSENFKLSSRPKAPWWSCFPCWRKPADDVEAAIPLNPYPIQF